MSTRSIRRSIRIVGIAISVVSVLTLAAPAMAQDIPRGARDPFDPLVTRDTGVPSGSTVTAPGTGTTTTPGAPGTGISGGLSNTGADPSPWLAAAYLLLSTGAAAVAWARIRAPQRT